MGCLKRHDMTHVNGPECVFFYFKIILNWTLQVLIEPKRQQVLWQQNHQGIQRNLGSYRKQLQYQLFSILVLSTLFINTSNYYLESFLNDLLSNFNLYDIDSLFVLK